MCMYSIDGPDVKKALAFIQKEFEKRVESEKKVFVQYIAARYKRDIKYSWEELKNVLVKDNLDDYNEAMKGRKKILKEKEKLQAKEKEKTYRIWCITRGFIFVFSQRVRTPLSKLVCQLGI